VRGERAIPLLSFRFFENKECFHRGARLLSLFSIFRLPSSGETTPPQLREQLPYGECPRESDVSTVEVTEFSTSPRLIDADNAAPRAEAEDAIIRNG